MGVRIIIATICTGFLTGYILGIVITWGDEYLGFEARILSIAWGLFLAALFGLVACTIDGLISYINSRPKKKILVPMPIPPPVNKF